MIYLIKNPLNKNKYAIKKSIYFKSINSILLNKLMINLKANLLNNKTLFKINCIKKIKQNSLCAILINSNKFKRNLYFTNLCLNFFFFF
jgi:hypothetical protein